MALLHGMLNNAARQPFLGSFMLEFGCNLLGGHRLNDFSAAIHS